MYFYYKLFVIYVSTRDIQITIKVTILVTLLVFASEILRIIPHLVTKNFRKLGFFENNFLIVFTLTKLTQTPEDLSDNLKTLMQSILFILILVRYFFICSLLIRTMAIKLINTNKKFVKILKISIFKRIFDGN